MVQKVSKKDGHGRVCGHGFVIHKEWLDEQKHGKDSHQTELLKP